MRLNVYFRSSFIHLGKNKTIMVNDESSVQNEQFNDKKDIVGNNEIDHEDENTSDTSLNDQIDQNVSETSDTGESDENISVSEDEPEKDSGDNQDSTKETNAKDNQNVTVDEVSEKKEAESDREKKTETIEPDDDKNENEEIAQDKQDIVDNNPEEKDSEDNKEKAEDVISQYKETDFSKFDKAQLVNTLEEVLQYDDSEPLGLIVDNIKNHFYKKQKAEIEKLKEKFLEEGGIIEDFKPVSDELENKLRHLLSNFKDKRAEQNRKLEEEKTLNLELKYQVIESIKDLVNRKESINKTFQDFRDLQQKWREIGLVPQQNVKGLWESYHLACEMFYDYININKELRDLDLKKNLEAKIVLCEKAEKLILEPSVVNSFKTLQLYHEQWREIGPVPIDKKTEIWERFKEITSKINKRHHQYFEGLKENQKHNLEEKTVLCEKVEEINELDLKNAKEWEEKSNEIIEIQKIWKTIGFAPKKDNNKIYSRFRTACDNFFNNKREFFAHNKEEQKNNLQLKTDLCVQAETLKDSKDWKNTTDQLIQLQKKWKQIGPVPKKYSDQVWDRFRTACDTFFNRKSDFFSNVDNNYEDNLKQKEDLIIEIEKYELVKDVDENFEKISDFQKRWTDIGFVPIKMKEEIQNRYRDAINSLFDKLKVDDEEKNILKYNNKLNDIISKPNASLKLKQEREKLIKKLTNLENDIVVWENNIGFFSNSKNADSLVKDVKTKIENGKKSIELMHKKIRTIDQFRDENNLD